MRKTTELDEEQQLTEVDLDAINDGELVELAKTGDHHAFGELVRRHRTKAFGWARTLTKDQFAADDIVQEALIRAFLHLGELINNQRFMPWLRKIVQNLAYMKLRRGGPYFKETPFTSYSSQTDFDETKQAATGSWDSIDKVLARLSQSTVDSLQQRADPVSVFMRRETVDGIRELLHCLNKREKAMFESYFFEQLQPKEIAALFRTSTNNVYNYISTSKRKVQQERIKVQIGVYVSMRRQLGLPIAKKLPPPPY